MFCMGFTMVKNVLAELNLMSHLILREHVNVLAYNQLHETTISTTKMLTLTKTLTASREMHLWASDVQQACRNLTLASYHPSQYRQVQVYDMNQANQALVKQSDAAQIWPTKVQTQYNRWVRRVNTTIILLGWDRTSRP